MIRTNQLSSQGDRINHYVSNIALTIYAFVGHSFTREREPPFTYQGVAQWSNGLTVGIVVLQVLNTVGI